MPDFIIKKGEHVRIDGALKYIDQALTDGLKNGDMLLGIFTAEEKRTALQNKKMWPMLSDFTKTEFNGRLWDAEHWKSFLMSAFNQEMPKVGLMGEPVSVNLSTSGLSKKKFSEFIEFMYSAGSERNVKWSEKSIDTYREYCNAKS